MVFDHGPCCWISLVNALWLYRWKRGRNDARCFLGRLPYRAVSIVLTLMLIVAKVIFRTITWTDTVIAVAIGAVSYLEVAVYFQ
jgi:hypothetical protein